MWFNQITVTVSFICNWILRTTWFDSKHFCIKWCASNDDEFGSNAVRTSLQLLRCIGNRIDRRVYFLSHSDVINWFLRSAIAHTATIHRPLTGVLKIEVPVVAVHKEVSLFLFVFELRVAFAVRNLFDCVPVTATPIESAHSQSNQFTVSTQQHTSGRN